MNLNESDPKKRTIHARWLDLLGNPLPSGHVFSAGDLKLVQPDGTVANATNLPTAVAGAAPGSFDVVLAQSEVQIEGDIRAQLSAIGVAYWEWVETVSAIGNIDTAAIASSVYAQVSAAGGLKVNLVQVQMSSTFVASYDVGDLEAPMRIALPFDGVNDTLSLAVSAQLRWKKPDGTVSLVAMTIADAVKRVVQRAWSAGDLAQAGIHTGEVVVTWATGRVQTVPTIYQWNVRAPLA